MWAKLLEKILPLLLTVITPTIKEMLCTFTQELKKKAEATPNPWDNVIAEISEEIFCPKQK